MKVLVAEDDKFLVKVYQAKLGKAGFVVEIATDGEEVEKIIESFDPDVILLDLMMPKKDGFEVLAYLKSSKFSHVPVIVTSNLSQPEDKQKALGLGAKDFVVKSDTPIEEIVQKLQSFSKSS